MPRGDRTGPNGMGTMTGRAAGFCAGKHEAGFTTAPGFFETGRFTARGFGRGAGRQAPPPPAPEQEHEAIGAEIQALERRIDYLKRELDAIDSRKKTVDE